MIIIYFTLSVIRENKSVNIVKGNIATFLFNSVACAGYLI